MHRVIVEQEEKLDRLFSHAKDMQKLEDLDDEAKSGFISYLCVRTSGYVESSVKTILIEHVRSTSSNIRTFNYVSAKLERMSPRLQIIESLLKQFDEQWSRNLKNSITRDQRESLDAIVDNRNEIAHGVDVDMSLLVLERYFGHAREVIGYVFDVCST